MKSLLIISLLFGVFTFAGCNKEKNKPAENIVITFSEPSVGDSIASYNSLHSEGTITATGKMKGYSIQYINNTTGEVVFESAYNVEADAYNFHEHWLNNVTTTTQVTIRVIVIKDNDGNLETKELAVTCLQ